MLKCLLLNPGRMSLVHKKTLARGHIPFSDCRICTSGDNKCVKCPNSVDITEKILFLM